MLFKKHVYLIQILTFLLIFPALALFEKQKIISLVCLLLVILLSILIAYIAPYRIDDAHKSRLNKKTHNNAIKKDV